LIYIIFEAGQDGTGRDRAGQDETREKYKKKNQITIERFNPLYFYKRYCEEWSPERA
jgi:hypothetical protein